MASATRSKTPPLQNGDRLSREELERRHDAMPGLKKAELIEGVDYMPSPVSLDEDADPHFNMIGWLGHYRWATPGVRGADSASVRLDVGHMPQPDVCLFIDPAGGGQARISADHYLEDAPELVAEIAASSVSDDLGVELDVHRRHRVREYMVWRVQDREIDGFILKRGRFVRLPLDEAGLYRSKVFPGLWLDPAGLIRDDVAALSAALARGLAHPDSDHARFVARLSAGLTK